MWISVTVRFVQRPINFQIAHAPRCPASPALDTLLLTHAVFASVAASAKASSDGQALAFGDSVFFRGLAHNGLLGAEGCDRLLLYTIILVAFIHV